MAPAFWQTTCAVLIPGILLASWIDYSQRRVPNWLNLALIIMGLAVQAWFFGWSGVGTGALGLLTGFGLLIVPWMMHGMGAGDVKLMAAIGVWLGPLLTLYSFALGAMIGGVVAVAMILSTGRLRMAGRPASARAWTRWPRTRSRPAMRCSSNWMSRGSTPVTATSGRRGACCSSTAATRGPLAALRKTVSDAG